MPQAGGYPPPPMGGQPYPPPGGYPPPPGAGYPGGGFGGGQPDMGAGAFQPGFVPHMPPPQQDGGGGGYGGYDPEDPEVKGFDFTDESIRKGFIRKVYSILCVSAANRSVLDDHNHDITTCFARHRSS